MHAEMESFLTGWTQKIFHTSKRVKDTTSNWQKAETHTRRNTCLVVGCHVLADEMN